MRISDWSSDVCASYLLALRVGPVWDDRLVVHPLGRLPRLLVARPAYLAARGMPASAEDLSAHQCIAYAYGDVPARWTIDGRERVAAGAFRSDSSEAVHRAARSEEHTSELQSLMRTSYAVFCLKK